MQKYYFFDDKSLSYKPVGIGGRTKLINFLKFSAFSIVLALVVLLLFLSTDVLETPNEISQKKVIKNYELQFSILNQKMNDLEQSLIDIETRDKNLYRNYFHTHPSAQGKLVFSSNTNYKNLENSLSSDLIVRTTERIDKLAERMKIQHKSLSEIEELAANKAKLLKSIPAILPIKNKDLKRIASGFGLRSDPFTRELRNHWGMDFTAKIGAPVYASGDGIIIRADDRAAGFGNHICIDHGFGYKSLYAHLSGYNIKKGQRVKRGQLIGYVGNTGRSVAPHLHYEVHHNDVPVNPINYYYETLNVEQFDALHLVASQATNLSLD